MRNQHLDQRRIIAPRGPHEGRPTAAISQIRVGFVLDQVRCHLDGARAYRADQRRIAVAVIRVVLCSVRQQIRDTIDIVGYDDAVQLVVGLRALSQPFL